MNLDRDELTKAILENPSIVIEYAKQADAELLDECFDIMFRSVKQSITERNVDWYMNHNTGKYNSTSLLENIINATDAIFNLYETCRIEFDKAFAKKNNISYRKPSSSRLTVENNLNNLEIHKIMQKMAELYVDARLENINFKGQEKYNQIKLKQRGDEE